MLSVVRTCVLFGLEGFIVNVETDVSRGMPVFNIVGLPDTAIKESKERVRSAIKNSGFTFPVSRITVNLAPASLKKEGSQLDLPIAVGILTAGDIIKYEYKDIYFMGELSLDGSINKVTGLLPMIIALRDKGINKFVIPRDNIKECCILNDVEIIAVERLNELVLYLNRKMECPKVENRVINQIPQMCEDDFSEIKGQENLKRALEVAAAGGHNVMMIGPPGSGKTMISRRIPTILPKLEMDEILEVTKIYSVAGILPESGIIYDRPFRSPHHTISSASLVGGGRIPRPGEVSLAHNGVLFLDEFPEFSKHVLEVLRQPIEDGFVNIARVHSSISYPSRFMLVAAMNPCPCGFLGDSKHQCTCTEREIKRYLSKISGPLLDRIDIHIQVNPVKYNDIKNNDKNIEDSETIRKRVEKSRNIQLKRYSENSFHTNSQLSSKYIEKYCKLDDTCEKLMKYAFDKLNFSTRAYHKVLKVARTIADLDNKTRIDEKHLAEAIQYRNLDRKYWMR